MVFSRNTVSSADNSHLQSSNFHCRFENAVRATVKSRRLLLYEIRRDERATTITDMCQGYT